MKGENKKTILLVEDEEITAMMEKKQLEDKGYIIYHVDTGEKAVQTVIDDNIQVDLILMDIDLGEGMDGTKAAEEILKQKEVPVVFLSSHTEPDVVKKTEKITSYGYVVKNSGTFILDTSIKMAFKLFNAYKQTKLINGKLEATIENLRIHQTELEMQNDELSKKQAELESLRLKYTELYDMLPAGYFTLNENGVILEANLTGADLLGVSRGDLLKQPFSSFINNDDQDAFYLHRKELFNSNKPQTCELWMKRNDGSYFPAYLKAISLDHDNIPQSSLLIMIENDIS